jgi:hypothetical protein
MAGIANLKDVIKLIEVIGTEIGAQVTADGFQPGDLLAFLQSEKFEKALKDTLDQWEQILPESQDIGILEGFELAKDLKQTVNAIAKAFTKKG